MEFIQFLSGEANSCVFELANLFLFLFLKLEILVISRARVIGEIKKTETFLLYRKPFFQFWYSQKNILFVFV